MAAILSNPQATATAIQQGSQQPVTSTLNPSTATNMFPYYGYYNNNDSLFQDPNADPRAQQFLQAFQKYDPNAHYVDNGSYGGSDGGGGQENWSFVGNDKLLPGGGPQGYDVNKGDFNPLRTNAGDIAAGNSSADTNNGVATATDRGMGSVIKPGQVNTLASANRDQLNNPNLIFGNDQYGYESPTSNIKQDHSIWDTLGPALPLLFGTIMSGGAMSPLLSSVLHAPQELDALGNGATINPLQLAMGAAGAIPGVSQVMPYVNAASTVYQAAKGNFNPLESLGANAAIKSIGGN